MAGLQQSLKGFGIVNIGVIDRQTDRQLQSSAFRENPGVRAVNILFSLFTVRNVASLYLAFDHRVIISKCDDHGDIIIFMQT